MLTSEEFKIMLFNYKAEINNLNKIIRQKQAELRDFKNSRKRLNYRLESLCQHELFLEYEPKFSPKKPVINPEES